MSQHDGRAEWVREQSSTNGASARIFLPQRAYAQLELREESEDPNDTPLTLLEDGIIAAVIQSGYSHPDLTEAIWLPYPRAKGAFDFYVEVYKVIPYVGIFEFEVHQLGLAITESVDFFLKSSAALSGLVVRGTGFQSNLFGNVRASIVTSAT